ncbi:uncharacterized protein [Elaeis guineensis]|uniref:uncharacterized protein n=1 Tax=Elaeis guineensis var. tenera TaxID=51953 RepID=UPI003C6D46D7
MGSATTPVRQISDVISIDLSLHQFASKPNFWVEVALSGVEVNEEDDTESDARAASMKVLPPWMIKQRMNVTKEQRGEKGQLKYKSEASVSTECNTGGTYKLADLNVEANASGDDEDDADWEEG